jgi:endonuclease YncB( thermonuclease family)
VRARRFGCAPAGIAVALLLALASGGTRAGCAEKAPSQGGSAGTAADAAPSPAARSGKVVRVRDGDSIVVLAGGVEREVRLHGIDAPELGQAYGKRARRRAGELAFGREIRLEPRGTDAYDRELAEVFLPDGRSLNREMVSAGLAWWYRRYSDDADLAAREREARTARRGLWADRNPAPPWDFREAGRK